MTKGTFKVLIILSCKRSFYLTSYSHFFNSTVARTRNTVESMFISEAEHLGSKESAAIFAVVSAESLSSPLFDVHNCSRHFTKRQIWTSGWSSKQSLCLCQTRLLLSCPSPLHNTFRLVFEASRYPELSNIFEWITGLYFNQMQKKFSDT